MDEILQKMRERERELEAELRRLRKAREIYERGVQGELFPSPPMPQRLRSKSTIKLEVLSVLRRYRDGLTALDILSELNKTTRPGMPREVLSPQLSRLKQAGRLVAERGFWRLPRSYEISEKTEKEVQVNI